MPISNFYFDPDGEGTSVFLGPTESRLMDLAWQYKTLSVKKAMTLMGDDSDLAYTTIMTILQRLLEKGLLRREKQGRNFVYHAVGDRETFVRVRVERIQSCLKRNFGV